MINIVEKYIGSHDHVEQGNQYYYYCPSCAWKNPRLSINYDENKFKCWKCGYSSMSIIKLLKDLSASDEDINRVRKALNLFEKYKPKDESNSTNFKERIKNKLRKKHKKDKKFVNWGGHKNILDHDKSDIFVIQALNVLYSRGLSNYEIRLYNICFDPDKNVFIFPSVDEEMRFDFYVTRDINTSFYRNVDDIHKTEVIFNKGLINFSDEIYIVEGVFDAYTMGYNAINNLGTMASYLLMQEVVKNNTPAVTLIYDDDAFDAMMRDCDHFYNLGIPTNFVDMRKTKFGDINEAGKQNLHKILELKESYKPKISLK